MLWQQLIKKISSASWCFAQEYSFGSLLFNLNSDGKEPRSYQTSSSILNNIIRPDEWLKVFWSYCYPTKATLSSKDWTTVFVHNWYSGREEKLSQRLVIVKKRKVISEWQHFTVQKDFGGLDFESSPEQSKSNAELGPGCCGFCPVGSSFQIMSLIFLSHSSVKSFLFSW